MVSGLPSTLPSDTVSHPGGNSTSRGSTFLSVPAVSLAGPFFFLGVFSKMPVNVSFPNALSPPPFLSLNSLYPEEPIFRIDIDAYWSSSPMGLFHVSLESLWPPVARDG